MGDPYKSKLAGHSLLYGGRCGTNIGPARCSCGAQSQISYSRVSERQAWHHQHKADKIDDFVHNGVDNRGNEVHL